ncbi:MAG: valine--tRNA ligase [Deltaproteobacteria bacterium RBG_13_65_10]|nr:MAG: valine--tRNA ligase [Deltaproteobacteria bacterium RBG_13_65_10]
MSSNRRHKLPEIPKIYSPAETEARWYAVWETQGYFVGEEDHPGPSFCIVIPPPNVTGSLHIGHALNNTLQDVLVRWKRMQGFNTAWIPGTDHAGIATQNVVERQLHGEGLDRHQLGREKFIERVWTWKAQSGSRIIEQLKRLGASCDWTRERFTMDEGLSRAVREVFARLYGDGLIYRAANQLVNWCVRCHTALSDIEVEHREVSGHLWYIRYPFAEGKGSVTVATTRPETMLGDVAVAVHPEDPRYAAIAGKRVILPLVGKAIPVIRDAYVDREMGTGALKITPGHDSNDFEVGSRHALAPISILTVDGKVNDAFLVDAEGRPIDEDAPARALVGRDRQDARKRVVEMIESQGLLDRVEKHRHAVGHCYRCGTVVEPMLSPQWFVRAKPLADPALAAVEDGRTRFHPAQWANTYFEWLHNIRDWCVSRQLWWGHRIPAWYCLDCDRDAITQVQGEELRSDRIGLSAKPDVSADAPNHCDRCGGANLIQDPDVLDTWFSSALWPFSTLGWPDETKALKTWYPTGTLVTSFDIIFFWVARMMMMGLRFTGEVPFRDVYIHALVRTETGEKMSKSKGNVIDPLDIVERYGADAFRFTLTALAAQGRDIRISEKRIEGYRNFVNKLWNAARFVLMNLEGFNPDAPSPAPSAADRWVRRELARSLGEVDQALRSYRFNDAALALYHFTWSIYCDWYIELSKPALQDPARRATTQAALAGVLRELVKALHPFIPFVTEEIWSALPHDKGEAAHVMVARYPEATAAQTDPEVDQLAIWIDTITRVRNIRGEMGIPPAQKVDVFLLSDDAPALAPLRAGEEHLLRLGTLGRVAFGPLSDRPPVSSMALSGAVEVHVTLPQVDLPGEARRLEKEIGKLDLDIEALDRKLANPSFLERAPGEVVKETRKRREEAEEARARLAESLVKIRAEVGGGR